MHPRNAKLAIVRSEVDAVHPHRVTGKVRLVNSAQSPALRSSSRPWSQELLRSVWRPGSAVVGHRPIVSEFLLTNLPAAIGPQRSDPRRLRDRAEVHRAHTWKST